MAAGKKTGGRTKGTPNRLTAEARQVLMNVLSDEFEALPELLKELKPSERIDAVFKLSKFVLPVMESKSPFFMERKYNSDLN